MREIKFKVWDKVLKKMYHFTNSGDVLSVGQFLEDQWIKEGRPKKDFILLQFTGLKDKNEKEVYEGDIVTNDICLPERIVIEIKDDLSYDYPSGYGYLFSQSQSKESVEVIGNAYENPELLEMNT